MLIKTISLWQPWATLVALGLKHYETRSWSTRYRGPLAIHAAGIWTRGMRNHATKLLSELAREFYYEQAIQSLYADTLPHGCIVARCTLADCIRAEDAWGNDMEHRLGDFSPGRFAWRLDNIRPLATPFPCTGRQGFFYVNLPEVAR